ncbi:MAG: hypothetical protein QOF59_1348 [Actinomycetota bacterium]|nr:hypothetical protein [Actinomycetota bacterium]MDQ1477937.1 hypothetical protein [Actinomycetota bacterium]
MARAKTELESVSANTDLGVIQKRKPKPPKTKKRRVASPKQVFERRYVQTVRSVDLWSVLKVAICFYLCALIVMLVAGVMLWWIASAAGVVSSVESFVGELVNNKDFRLLSWQVLRAATLIGLVVVCLLTVMTVLAAAFYNLFSELLGGIEVTVVEQEELSG